jgi:hypothetical protein
MGYIEYLKTSYGDKRGEKVRKSVEETDTCVNLSWCDINKILKVVDVEHVLELDLSHNTIQMINGLNGLKNLQRLNLSSNGLRCIMNISHLKNLQTLDVSGNKIGLVGGLGGLDNLRGIDLSRNGITQLWGLKGMMSLRSINLSHNKIKYVEDLGQYGLKNLRTLWLCDNKIKNIESLGTKEYANLNVLALEGNEIEHIKGLDELKGLEHLFLSRNKLTKIEGLDNLRNLKTIRLCENKINTIPMAILRLPALTEINIDKHIPIDPIIVRFLQKNMVSGSKSVYNDAQNIHDSQINDSISESLFKLLDEKVNLSDEKIIEEILADNVLISTVKSALIEYSKIPDVHSKLGVTFFEALKVTWEIVRKHENTEEIKRIMNQEIQDSLCKCFTGRLSRLVNCLNGFDPRVRVRISDSQEISNLIIAIKSKTDKLDEQIMLVRKEMVSRGYDKSVINEWISYLE